LNAIKSSLLERASHSLNEDVLMSTWWRRENESSDNGREKECLREGWDVLPLTSPKATLECPIIKMLRRRRF
jgi:hypothetical protein